MTPNKPLQLAPNTPQYFFDDALIAHHQCVVRRWLPAKIFPKPIVEPDRPWEGRILGLFGTILPDEEGYRLYYSSFTPGGEYGKVMLARSQDGFSWNKPKLNCVEWHGSTANNIVLWPTHDLDSPSVIFEAQDKEAPYKMVSFQVDHSHSGWRETRGLYGSVSQDGVHWTSTSARMINAGDRTNMMASRPGGKYVAYTRHPDMMQIMGARSIYRSESPDFQEWSEPELVLAPDLEDEPDVEYYGMSVFERHGWYIGLLEYWRSAADVLETYLVVSRDGKKWLHPTPRRPFIGASYDWNRTWSSCTSNGPIIINEQMVFYFGGRWTSHHYDSAQQYGTIGYASLPLDRFCALEATYNGLLVTQPLLWPGGDLVFNVDTRDSYDSHPSMYGGEIAVEVLDGDSQPLAGWSGNDKPTYSSNTHQRCHIYEGLLRWPGERSLDALRGQAIRLRFHLNHARLFTIEAKTTS